MNAWASGPVIPVKARGTKLTKFMAIADWCECSNGCIGLGCSGRSLTQTVAANRRNLLLPRGREPRGREGGGGPHEEGEGAGGGATQGAVRARAAECKRRRQEACWRSASTAGGWSASAQGWWRSASAQAGRSAAAQTRPAPCRQAGDAHPAGAQGEGAAAPWQQAEMHLLFRLAQPATDRRLAPGTCTSACARRFTVPPEHV